MTPQHVDGRLSDYLDGNLSARERKDVDAHLAGCTKCARELDCLRRIRSRLAARPDGRSPGLWRNIAPQVRAAAAAGAWVQFEWAGKRLMPFLAAAAVLAAAFLGSLNRTGTVATLEDYLKSTFTSGSADSLLVSDSEISREDVLYLAATTQHEGRR